MKAKYLALVLLFFATAGMFIIYATCNSGHAPSREKTIPSTTYIINQNKLNVIFPGQNLIIKSSNTSTSRICYSIYEDAWMPEREGKAYDGACYDFEGNVAGDCGPGSDLEIKDGTIMPLNGAEMFIIGPPDFNDTEFLCSNITPHIFYDGYKDEVCRSMKNTNECINSVGTGNYSDNKLIYFETRQTYACITTGGGNYFKYRIDNYNIEQKQERIPDDMTCLMANDSSITVETSSLESGVYNIAYTAETLPGTMEKTRTCKFVKTDLPYSSVSNPNFNSIMYPENKEETPGFYIFNELLINAEYTEELTGIWYRCDEGEWHISNAEGKFAYVKVDESLCKTVGEHSVFYFAESHDLNGTMNEYLFFQNTEKPWAENASIRMERAGNMYMLELNYEFNSPAGLKEHPVILNWYQNGGIIGYGRTIDTWGGSSITVELIPADITGLRGAPVNLSITVPNEPPGASDINISVCFKYPPAIIAMGDYHDPDSTPEGQSIYKWYRGGILVGEGREMFPDFYLSQITIEYTPVDAAGLAGGSISKAISIPEKLMDSWLYLSALYHSNATYCGRIRNASLSNKCLDIVGLSTEECSDRPAREKFFCLAFITSDPEYCNYIDINWYRLNCLTFVAGNPRGCADMGAGRDECIVEFASSSGNQDLCTNITEPDMNSLCNALASKNTGMCSSIADISLRKRCLSDASYR